MPTVNHRKKNPLVDAAQDAARAGLEVAEKIARVSLDASTDAARKMQQSFRGATNVLIEERGNTRPRNRRTRSNTGNRRTSSRSSSGSRARR